MGRKSRPFHRSPKTSPNDSLARRSTLPPTAAHCADESVEGSLDLPVVSCIMPTANRRRFVPEAIRLFLAQDYPEKELVVVDDGEDSVANLIPTHRQIWYVRLDRRQSTGAKRNLACTVARGGIIAHWDDDDWYAPWRLSYQVAEIVRGADLCGLARMLFFDPSARRAWEYVYPIGGRPWVYGLHSATENPCGSGIHFLM
jgi:glycosyltransferase involved in cell wall biosynthesis